MTGFPTGGAGLGKTGCGTTVVVGVVGVVGVVAALWLLEPPQPLARRQARRTGAVAKRVLCDLKVTGHPHRQVAVHARA